MNKTSENPGRVEKMFPTAPFNFRLMLQRPLSRPSELLQIDESANSLTRVLRVEDKVVPMTVVGLGTVDSPELEIHLPTHLRDDERLACLSQVRFMFSVDRDLSDFVRTVSEDAAWQNLFLRYAGLRPTYDANLFEAMVKVIIGQQLNVKFAATLVERLVHHCGEVVAWQGKQLHAFPTPGQVAACSYEDLRALSFSQRKAEYIIDFSRNVVTGKLDLEHLWQLSDDEVIASLTKLRGIGRWTVECFMLFGMGRPDVLPAADIGVQNALKVLYDMTERPREAQLRDMAESWAPWRSYATYYLWNSLIP